VLKHFIVGLLLELQQQLMYKQAKTFDDMGKLAKRK
jgi:hypothetical protein